MPDAETMPGKRSLSIIVPTFREAENLPELIDRIERVCDEHGLKAELLIMDDNSRDGTEELIATLQKPWVRLVVRTENRGLSAAVLDGFCLAQHDVLVVMDADLSHPPEQIPELVAALDAGADFVIGSRYVAGGSTDEDWGLLRWLNSKAATLLARPFTSAKDPMSGFFALRRETLARAPSLNPVGYKIGLEILVKCGCRAVREAPIHFSQRRRGKSKLSLREQMRYLQHLRRLAVYKYGDWAHFVQFAAVGFSGTVVNLAVLTALVWAHAPLRLSVAVAILVSMFTNFLLNRWITFSYARQGSFWGQMAGFFGASSIGAVVNYGATLGALWLWPALERVPQIAAVLGILAGLTFNFFMSRHLVFRKPAD